LTDLVEVHEYAADVDVCRYMVHGPNTIEESKQFLEMAIAEIGRIPCQNLHLAIVNKSDELIGACALGNISQKHLDADLGYCLNKHYWNMGYATEAAKALVEYGFSVMKLHRIHATCRPANVGSARVLQKAGMQLEGHLRENLFLRGKWEDSLMYAVLISGWKPQEGLIRTEK
jgi:RimJ/RimL family protein N-acetyltransferase